MCYGREANGGILMGRVITVVILALSFLGTLINAYSVTGNSSAVALAACVLTFLFGLACFVADTFKGE
jgi:hypothetical protein